MLASSTRDCDTTALARRFEALQPDDADAWKLAFTAAVKARDARAMRAAITGFAGATNALNNHDGRFVQLLLQQAKNFAPTDRHLIRALAGSSNYYLGLAAQDAYQLRGYCDPETIGSDATLREDCGRIAGLLSRSDNVNASVSGIILQYRLAAEPERAALQAELRNRMWLRHQNWQMVASTYDWMPGYIENLDEYEVESIAAGKRWQAAWSDAGNEAMALRHWQEMQHLPIAAPADYRLSDGDIYALSVKPVLTFQTVF